MLLSRTHRDDELPNSLSQPHRLPDVIRFGQSPASPEPSEERRAGPWQEPSLSASCLASLRSRRGGGRLAEEEPAAMQAAGRCKCKLGIGFFFILVLLARRLALRACRFIDGIHFVEAGFPQMCLVQFGWFRGIGLTHTR
jgi:hypothetical protein